MAVSFNMQQVYQKPPSPLKGEQNGLKIEKEEFISIHARFSCSPFRGLGGFKFIQNPEHFLFNACT